MAKRILAPINGRPDSELVVPVLSNLARGAGAVVRLLRVFPVPQHIVGRNGRTIAYVDQEMARLTAAGMKDLAPIEAALHDVPVETVVRFGDAAEEIVLEAEAFDADLIALGTARRGRVRRALAPDVADRVAATATVPTLVLHA